ncbi:MAG: hypothetical protein JRH14_10485 [Deltaproteobacteria bacterium]|nr:hypothetical protein [Deltaproteobacteria bacterium]
MNRRRAIALASLVSLTAWAATASAGADPVLIADAVRNLDSDHDQAIAAVYVLQAGGERAAKQIRDAWPTLSVLGQKRALGALSQLAKEHPAAVEALVEAARSHDEEIRERALATLRRTTPRGRAGLVALLSDPVVGDRAASVLARTEPDFAVEPLLDATASPGGEDRHGLRSALATAVQRAGKDAKRPLRAWLSGGPPPAAVASVAICLASLDGYQGVVASFVEYAVAQPIDFAATWRLLQSAGAAGSKLDGPEEWMLRQAAVDAVTARGHREDARGSLADPYPRVRASAATVLSGDPDSLVERATLARRDSWPMVRAEAVTSLRTEGDAIPVIVASVDDSMSVVRAAAIGVLAASSHDRGWERVHQRLRARNEWPQVTAAAIDYVVAHCRTDGVEALFRVVMRAAPSNALTDDLNNAARAIEALRALGTPEAKATVEQLRGTEGVPPTLKMALEQPLPVDAGCALAGR